MNIDSIITEWTYRLEKGYPDCEDDYVELRNVLQEMTNLPEAEQNVIVNRAMGLTEDEGQELDLYQDLNDTLKLYSTNYIDFDLLIKAIISSDQSKELIQLIKNPSNKSIERGAYPIRGIEETLYDIIMKTTKITYGDPSELWLAIVFDGNVQSATQTAESSIVSDVEIDGASVSLKNYEKITFNFGTLPSTGRKLLSQFLNFVELLTGEQINISMTNKSVNRILDYLDKEGYEIDIRQFLSATENTDIAIIGKLRNRIEQFYTLDDNLDKLIESFCKIIDDMLREKVMKVIWWGMIIKGPKVLYLETSENIYNQIKCRNDRLSPAVSKFANGMLFILGSQLGLGITTKKG